MQKVGINTSGNGVQSTKNIKKIQLQNKINPVDIIEKQFVNKKSSTLADSLGLLVKGAGVVDNIIKQQNKVDLIDEKKELLNKKEIEKINKANKKAIEKSNKANILQRNSEINTKLESNYNIYKNENKNNKGFNDLKELDKRENYLQSRIDEINGMEGLNDDLKKGYTDNLKTRKSFINKGVSYDKEFLKQENTTKNNNSVFNALSSSENNKDFNELLGSIKNTASNNGTENIDFNNSILNTSLTSGSKEQLNFLLNDYNLDNGLKFSNLEGFRTKLQNRLKVIDTVEFEKDNLELKRLKNMISDDLTIDIIIENTKDGDTISSVEKYLNKTLENINKDRIDNKLKPFNKNKFNNFLLKKVEDRKSDIRKENISENSYKNIIDSNNKSESKVNEVNKIKNDKLLTETEKNSAIKKLDEKIEKDIQKNGELVLTGMSEDFEKNIVSFNNSLSSNEYKFDSVTSENMYAAISKVDVNSDESKNIFLNSVKLYLNNKKLGRGKIFDGEMESKINMASSYFSQQSKSGTFRTQDNIIKETSDILNIDLKSFELYKKEKDEQFKNNVENNNFFGDLFSKQINDENYSIEDKQNMKEFTLVYGFLHNGELPSESLIKKIASPKFKYDVNNNNINFFNLDSDRYFDFKGTNLNEYNFDNVRRMIAADVNVKKTENIDYEDILIYNDKTNKNKNVIKIYYLDNNNNEVFINKYNSFKLTETEKERGVVELSLKNKIIRSSKKLGGYINSVLDK